METAAPLAVIFQFVRNAFTRPELTPEERAAAEALRKTPTFSLLGCLTAGKATAYSINGVDFEIDPGTLILGELRYGANARVVGTYRHHTVRCARKIAVEPSRVRPPKEGR